MSNKYFTDAISEETLDKLTGELLNLSNTPKKKNFKIKAAKKIISTAAAVILVTGLLNITTVIAFFHGLFFIPGIGLTEDETIIFAMIDEPIDIVCDYGTLTLQFVSKVTRDGKTDLALYIDTSDVPASASSQYPLSAVIHAGEEIIERDYLGGSGTWSSDGKMNYVSYEAVFENFPDVDEFDFTIRGVTTHIILSKQEDNYALSQENGGIIMALYKFNGVNSIIGIDVIDRNIGSDDWIVYPFAHHSKFHSANENEINWNIGNTIGQNETLSYNLLRNFDNTEEIKSYKADSIMLWYRPKVWETRPTLEIPVPKDGETIKTDIQLNISKFVYKITEVRREENMLYFEDNSAWVGEVTNFELGQSTYNSSRFPMPEEGTPEYEKAVKNGDAYLCMVDLMAEDWETYEKVGNVIRLPDTIDENDENGESKTIKMNVSRAEVRQYGNFDIEFD